jgi:hypothetical protein
LASHLPCLEGVPPLAQNYPGDAPTVPARPPEPGGNTPPPRTTAQPPPLPRSRLTLRRAAAPGRPGLTTPRRVRRPRPPGGGRAPADGGDLAAAATGGTRPEGRCNPFPATGVSQRCPLRRADVQNAAACSYGRSAGWRPPSSRAPSSTSVGGCVRPLVKLAGAAAAVGIVTWSVSPAEAAQNWGNISPDGNLHCGVMTNHPGAGVISQTRLVSRLGGNSQSALVVINNSGASITIGGTSALSFDSGPNNLVVASCSSSTLSAGYSTCCFTVTVAVPREFIAGGGTLSANRGGSSSKPLAPGTTLSSRKKLRQASLAQDSGARHT